jgi:hypothetical protein
MQGSMECRVCGAQFYSSAGHQMVLDGERCTCGGPLRECEEPLRPKRAALKPTEFSPSDVDAVRGRAGAGHAS